MSEHVDEPRCDHCPVPRGLSCPRWPSDHTRYCEWADPSHRAHRRSRVAEIARIAARRRDRPDPGPSVPVPPEVVEYPAPAESPPLATRAANLAGAVVSAVASGGKTVTPEERERRLAICRDCEHFEPEGVRCRQCGCYLSLKSRLMAWHCPIEKW